MRSRGPAARAADLRRSAASVEATYSVKLQNIPRFLQKHAADDIIVEFDNGDRYPATVLDLRGENEDGEFEIYVSFDYCLGRCQAYQRAMEAGLLHRSTPGCWWTSEEPRRPVGMRYTLDRIKSIRDDGGGYCVFETT